MKDISIPSDIKNYVKKKVISCVLFFIFLELVAVGLNVSMFDSLSSILDTWVHILFIVVLQIVPFVISKFPLNIIDKSWRGEVISVDIKTKTDAFFAGGKTHSFTNHQIILKVKKENDQIVTITAKQVGEPNPETTWMLGYTVPNQGDIKAFINYYSEGDKVYHFYKVPFYYIDKLQSIYNDCIICGTQNTSERDDCVNCGFSLIKPD